MKESKYYKKHHKTSLNKTWLTKLLLSIIVVLICLIYTNISQSNKEYFKKNLLEKNISFTTINKYYKKFIGNVKENEIPKQTELMTFAEDLKYTKKEKIDDSYKLEVGENYAVPFLKSGIIVFVGEKDNLGNTVIVQGNDGVDIWYSNVSLNDHSLYDYIKNGEIIGPSLSEYITLTFMKNGTPLTYEEYLE